MKKKKKLRQCLLGMFLICLLLFSLFFPMFNGKSSYDILLDSSITNDLITYGDEQENDDWWIEPVYESGEIYKPPDFNWSKFWNVFKNHALWKLEAKNPSGIWVDATELLTVYRNYTGDNTCKIGLEFTTPDNGLFLDWRFTLGIDYLVKQFVNKTGNYEYTLSYEAFGEDFNVVFNWSDMLQYSGLIFSHGVKDDIFWFCVRRNAVPPDFYVYLDPEYVVHTGNVVLPSNNARYLIRESNGTLVTSMQVSTTNRFYNSEDNGVTWNNYKTISSCGYLSICIDSNDTIHGVGYGGSTDLVYINSTDWDLRVIDVEANIRNPAVAIDSNDIIHLVYEKPSEGSSNDEQVAYMRSTNNGLTFSSTTNLTDESDSGDDEWYPSIVIDSNDVVHVVFTAEDYDTDPAARDEIMHMQSSTNGVSWDYGWNKDIITPMDDGHNSRFASFMIDANDYLHIVYEDDVGDDFYHCFNNTVGWSTIEKIYDTQLGLNSISYSTSDDYKHVAYSGVDYDIFYNYNDTVNWAGNSEIINTTLLLNYICLIYANYPIIASEHTNIPKNGYCFVWRNTSTNMKFYKSSDLAWGVDAGEPPVPTDTPPTIETNFTNGSYENPVGMNFSTVWFNDSQGDITNNWMNCSTGDFWSVNNSNVSGYIILSGLNYFTKYWVNCSSSDVNNNTLTNYWFYTKNDTVTITLIDYMPTNLRTNNTGEAWFLYNITTNDTPINFWSIVWAYGVNHTLTNTHNTSYSLADHLAEDKLRGINRNVNETIELKFNTTAGDGSIGGFGEWNTHDGNKNITLVDSGTNWTLVNATEVIAEHLFNTISFVDIEELAIEEKTSQTIEISKTNFIKIEFNMTDTGWYNDGHYKNTSMFFHLYANQTNANKPLDIFYANSNYTTGNIVTSPYTELVGDIHQTDTYHFNEYNSSYYEIDFNINTTGYVGSVDATSKFYIILSSQAPSAKKWDLHYADGNLSHTLGGNTHYHDFDNRTIITISDDSAASWTANNSTPDVYFNYVSLDEEDKSEVKLYANDTSGNSAWSSVHVDLIDITNYPPDPANIIVPNVDTNYTVGDTIPINYHWIGDPNLNTCWVNITLWDWETTTQQGWIVNQSITDVERENTVSNFTYNWDTTGTSASNYTIAINITDDSLWNNHSSEIFYINATPPLPTDTPPTIQTNFSNGSYENPIGMNFSNVWFNDSQGDITNNWMNASEGSFWSVNNSNVTGYIILSGLSYFTKYWVNCSSSDANNNTLTSYWFYTKNYTALPTDTPPTIETNFTNGSYENPIGMNFSIVYFNDSQGDITNNWMNCSTGDFWSVNNSNVTGYIILSGLSYFTKYWVNCSSSDANNNTLVNYWFYTKNYTVLPTDTPTDFQNESPNNNSGNQELSFTWSCDVYDAEGDIVNWSIQCLNFVDYGFQQNDTANITLSALSYLTEYTVFCYANDTAGNFTQETFNFTTKSATQITISNIYPGNNTYNIDMQPYLYALFNSTDEDTLNITWYHNNMVFGTENSVNNGTYNELMLNATSRATSYTWTVKVNDGMTHWLNNSYTFQTEGYNNNMGYIPTSNTISYLGIFGIIAFALVLMLIFLKKRQEEE